MGTPPKRRERRGAVGVDRLRGYVDPSRAEGPERDREHEREDRRDGAAHERRARADALEEKAAEGGADRPRDAAGRLREPEDRPALLGAGALRGDRREERLRHAEAKREQEEAGEEGREVVREGDRRQARRADERAARDHANLPERARDPPDE